MAKLIIVSVLLIGAVVAISAAPANVYEPLEMEEMADEYAGAELEDPEDHLRFRRVTCDLLSFGGKVNHSACAANCLSMGKAGGSCNGGVCQCRKTKITDLWNRRFG